MLVDKVRSFVLEEERGVSGNYPGSVIIYMYVLGFFHSCGCSHYICYKRERSCAHAHIYIHIHIYTNIIAHYQTAIIKIYLPCYAQQLDNLEGCAHLLDQDLIAAYMCFILTIEFC